MKKLLSSSILKLIKNESFELICSKIHSAWCFRILIFIEKFLWYMICEFWHKGLQCEILKTFSNPTNTYQNFIIFIHPQHKLFLVLIVLLMFVHRSKSDAIGKYHFRSDSCQTTQQNLEATIWPLALLNISINCLLSFCLYWFQLQYLMLYSNLSIVVMIQQVGFPT